jgi:hypothetical protein
MHVTLETEMAEVSDLSRSSGASKERRVGKLSIPLIRQSQVDAGRREQSVLRATAGRRTVLKESAHARERTLWPYLL